ncbi:hypothetical protein JCM6882_000520 [Rhodosporidiobolus microsporus]
MSITAVTLTPEQQEWEDKWMKEGHAELQFANFPVAKGWANIKAALTGPYSLLDGMKHTEFAFPHLTLPPLAHPSTRRAKRISFDPSTSTLYHTSTIAYTVRGDPAQVAIAIPTQVVLTKPLGVGAREMSRFELYTDLAPAFARLAEVQAQAQTAAAA